MVGAVYSYDCCLFSICVLNVAGLINVLYLAVFGVLVNVLYLINTFCDTDCIK